MGTKATYGRMNCLRHELHFVHIGSRPKNSALIGTLFLIIYSLWGISIYHLSATLRNAQNFTPPLRGVKWDG